MTPLLAMHSLGHNFVPPPIHAGGLRYHGMAPLVSKAAVEGLIDPRAIHQLECYEAGILFAKTEGIIPAPETTHAIAAAIHEAKKAKEEGKEKVILFSFSGHGLMDLVGYDKYLTGQLSDFELPDEIIKENLEAIKGYPLPGGAKKYSKVLKKRLHITDSLFFHRKIFPLTYNLITITIYWNKT